MTPKLTRMRDELAEKANPHGHYGFTECYQQGFTAAHGLLMPVIEALVNIASENGAIKQALEKTREISE